jgi:hypothetical protein
MLLLPDVLGGINLGLDMGRTTGLDVGLILATPGLKVGKMTGKGGPRAGDLPIN